MSAANASLRSPSLQARKQQLVRDAIWDAAVELFTERGFDATTVEEIAERAGVSRRSFFRYFASKSDLMAEGVVSYGEELTEVITGCAPGMSLGEVFRYTVERVAVESVAHPRTLRIMQIAANCPSARSAQLSRMAQVQDRVAAAYAGRCTTEGGDDRLMASILAGLTLSVLAVAFRAWIGQGGGDMRETVGRIFVTMAQLMPGV